MTNEVSSAGGPPRDFWFTAILAGLMIVIVVSLAVLWHRERQRRITAENALVVLQQKYQQAAGLLTQALVGRMGDLQVETNETPSTDTRTQTQPQTQP